MIEELTVTPLAGHPDDRGLSFSLPLELLGAARDTHVATIRPGHVRGNHFHAHKYELIGVLYRGAWSLHWDTGPGTPARHRTFTGDGAVVVAVPKNWAHAVRNDGESEILIIVASDQPYDPTDSVARGVTD
ncbi:hypothetical protein Lesp02_65510 [Lentzea sp. NBRC 105346]|uniref:polysaccharide biosynthesis C-terminal domain-containing protein n=1 Tax=Lentzea sp. NBRC 105346 TaxID=3032205 RepID=UPI0024A2C0BA|nr:hypothetical protein [Lentzea sp. NBRC 105346]GLZ34364.1 hypothetical protein Lesp02_65510 [Lentzea sp. NBRC 105346]